MVDSRKTSLNLTHFQLVRSDLRFIMDRRIVAGTYIFYLNRIQNSYFFNGSLLGFL